MMHINETPPSIRRIDTNRADAYAFEVTGQIDAADVENIYGLLEGAFTLHDKIDLIIIFHDYEGINWNAAWREHSVRGRLQALKRIRKYAVVGGPGWVKPVIGLLKPFLPAEVRQFERDEIAEAWDWISAKPVST